MLMFIDRLMFVGMLASNIESYSHHLVHMEYIKHIWSRTDKICLFLLTKIYHHLNFVGFFVTMQDWTPQFTRERMVHFSFSLTFCMYIGFFMCSSDSSLLTVLRKHFLFNPFFMIILFIFRVFWFFICFLFLHWSQHAHCFSSLWHFCRSNCHSLYLIQFFYESTIELH